MISLKEMAVFWLPFLKKKKKHTKEETKGKKEEKRKEKRKRKKERKEVKKKEEGQFRCKKERKCFNE